MTVISVSLSEERAQQLQRLSQDLGLPQEELARAAIEGWIAKRRVEFDAAATKVLAKNAELYRRLAQ